ncbi:ATP-binding protein [Parabacteroides distasonis]|uniref:AAA family ATPase n=1 Tax=Parabacteroides distasonis TaxID=823 RepID=UPI0039B3FBCC
MTRINNPFITSGYISADYFCDREAESKQLIREIVIGNNLAIISTRRMGKTGLIQHCFHSKELSKEYYTFFVDIYATKSLRDFIFSLSKVILESLKPFGKKAVEIFINSVLSLQAGISYDFTGTPSFNIQLGDIQNSMATLEEIFKYLAKADKPCIVAIDEFQQITNYSEKNVEALLRTHIQHCNNAQFIFAGSQRHTMGNMFLSASRPFYQSVSMMHLESIAIEKYIDFARNHFKKADRTITPETIRIVYDRFDGVTWYVQKTLNVLFAFTPIGATCDESMVEPAIASVVDSYRFNYQETLFRLPERQKELLVAIAKEGNAKSITSGEFVKRYSLTSPSSVQAAVKGLLEKDFITLFNGSYSIYDKLFEIWLRESY